MGSDRDLADRSRRLIKSSQELVKGARAHVDTAARSLANAQQHLDRTRNLLQAVWLRRALKKTPPIRTRRTST
jgi:hypothetical protein